MHARDHLPIHSGVEKLHALTGLRFLAAAMIVAHHSRALFPLVDRLAGGLRLETGVSFFFVLSGFILTHVYPDLHAPGALRRFCVARFARVWPAHVFTFALVLATGAYQQLPAPGAPPLALLGLANLAMVHAWVPATGWFFSFNAVSWSVSTEVFFYLLFPLLIAGFSRTWWWKLGLALALVAALVLGCERWGVPTFAAAAPYAINRGGLLYISPFVRVAEFVLGMVAARVWKRLPALGSLRPAAATGLELLAIAGTVGCLLAFPGPAALGNLVGSSFAAYLVRSGAAPFFAVLIVVFASHRGALSRFFAAPAMILLGEISFSIYLLHKIYLTWLTPNRLRLPQAGPGAYLAWASFWLVLLVTAWAVWRWIERPLRTLLLRWLGRRHVAPSG